MLPEAGASANSMAGRRHMPDFRSADGGEATAPFGRGGPRAAKQGGSSAMATSDRVSYWNKTKSLMFVMLGLWVFFGYVIHMFVAAAQQHRHSRLPARLLHGRAGFAHRLRRHAVLVRTQAEQRSTKSMASMKSERGGTSMANTTATHSRRRRFHLQSRPHLRHLHRRLHRLHHPDGDPQRDRRAKTSSSATCSWASRSSSTR